MKRALVIGGVVVLMLALLLGAGLTKLNEEVFNEGAGAKKIEQIALQKNIKLDGDGGWEIVPGEPIGVEIISLKTKGKHCQPSTLFFSESVKANMAPCGNWGYMKKNEFVVLEGKKNRKLEIEEWNNATIEKNKLTVTGDITKHEYLKARGTGYETMEVASDNFIFETGTVKIRRNDP